MRYGDHLTGSNGQHLSPGDTGRHGSPGTHRKQSPNRSPSRKRRRAESPYGRQRDRDDRSSHRHDHDHYRGSSHRDGGYEHRLSPSRNRYGRSPGRDGYRQSPDRDRQGRSPGRDGHGRFPGRDRHMGDHHRSDSRSHRDRRPLDSPPPRRHQGQESGSPGPRGQAMFEAPLRRQGRQEGGAEGAPPLGSIHQASVQSVRPFGVFVELPGWRRHGLIHHSQVSEEVSFARDDEDDVRVKALDFYLPRGSQVWVKVLEVREDPNGNLKINCSAKAVDQDSGKDLDPENRLAQGGGGGGGGGGRDGPQKTEPPDLGSIHRATVATIKPFGVFVRIQGYRSNGLVHFTQISDHLDLPKEDSDESKIKSIGEVLEIGEPIWVKVVEVKEEEGERGRGPKIACSIKLVDQKSGEDLDVHNLRWQPRREGGGPAGRTAIGASAAQIEAGGKIDWGHLRADNVKYRNSDKYALVEDLVEEEEKQEAGGAVPPDMGPGSCGPWVEAAPLSFPPGCRREMAPAVRLAPTTVKNLG
eukprot:jgi/Botrbrau1/11224/Bobra.0075s0020.1